MALGEMRGAMAGIRKRVFTLLEREPPVDFWTSIVHRALILLILVNITSAVLDTVAPIHVAWGGLLDGIELGSLAVFTLEYGLRLWVVPEAPIAPGSSDLLRRLNWMASPAGLIDLAAILPFLVDQFFDVDLRFVVLMRLMRFLKIARYSPGFQSLLEAVRTERHALLACLVILGSTILISAGMLYVAEHNEQPDKFGSIPEAMWWAVATVTTVGYGDVVPVTTAGRIVGAVTMIAGLLMLALPAGIVATAFANIIARRNFVVTAGLVARMPIFAGLQASHILDLLPAIATRTFDQGEYIVRRGESVRALYLVADGQLLVRFGHNHRLLGRGDSFGGDTRSTRKTVRANARTRLLILDVLEAKWLLASYPHLVERITEAA